VSITLFLTFHCTYVAAVQVFAKRESFFTMLWRERSLLVKIRQAVTRFQFHNGLPLLQPVLLALLIAQVLLQLALLLLQLAQQVLLTLPPQQPLPQHLLLTQQLLLLIALYKQQVQFRQLSLMLKVT
jgi:hypothetical protein